jgi:hypothetical protein
MANPRAINKRVVKSIAMLLPEGLEGWGNQIEAEVKVKTKGIIKDAVFV